MGLALWLALSAPLPLVAFYFYARINDAKLSAMPADAVAFSPARWTPDEVEKAAKRVTPGSQSMFSPEELPPKTGRRYIVVGGAGFLGGWIVLHLLARGEDPRRIRILDLRRPVRSDLLEGRAAEVDFVQVDISDPEAVERAFSKPWPVIPGESEPPLTVFHSAATIRFYERREHLQPLSDRINVHGTQNLLDAARRAGATAFVYTSSGSVSVHRTRFWLWPWQSGPAQFVQYITDDDARVPQRHAHFFSNYAASKYRGERVVRAADGSPTPGGAHMRTGCIRPGNGIYGPGGDLLVGACLLRGANVDWFSNIVQSFVFVENCSVAHLCYEARLIDPNTVHADVGGGAFCVADAGPPAAYADVHGALAHLTRGACSFRSLSPTLMLGLATLVEAYYLLRHKHRWLPALRGDVVSLQPSMFALTQVHLVFDDARARKPAAEGGLGYSGRVTTMEGVCKVWEEHRSGSVDGALRVVAAHDDAPSHGFGLSKAERAAEEIIEKLGTAAPLKARI